MSATSIFIHDLLEVNDFVYLVPTLYNSYFMSAERRPFSGRIVEAVQRRYIQNRIKSGTATEESLSEFILQPLKEKGIVGGFKDAVRRIEDVADIFLGADKSIPEQDRKIVKILFVGGSIIMGSAEVVLIASGINIDKMGKGGDWKPLVKLAEKIEQDMEEKGEINS